MATEKSSTRELLKRLECCDEGLKWAGHLPLKTLWKICENPYWMQYFLTKIRKRKRSLLIPELKHERYCSCGDPDFCGSPMLGSPKQIRKLLTHNKEFQTFLEQYK